MSYGLPTRGQADWDDELNNSIENLRGKADAATAKADNAVSTANSATNLALAADQRSRRLAAAPLEPMLGEAFGAAELDSTGKLPEGQVPDRLTEPSLNATIAATFRPSLLLRAYLTAGATPAQNRTAFQAAINDAQTAGKSLCVDGAFFDFEGDEVSATADDFVLWATDTDTHRITNTTRGKGVIRFSGERSLAENVWADGANPTVDLSAQTNAERWFSFGFYFTGTAHGSKVKDCKASGFMRGVLATPFPIETISTPDLSEAVNPDLRDFTIDGLEVENVWCAFQPHAIDGLNFRRIRGSYVAGTVGGADPHLVYGTQVGGSDGATPEFGRVLKNVVCGDSHATGGEVSTAFKFRGVKGLTLTGGLTAENTPGLLDLILIDDLTLGSGCASYNDTATSFSTRLLYITRGHAAPISIHHVGVQTGTSPLLRVERCADFDVERPRVTINPATADGNRWVLGIYGECPDVTIDQPTVINRGASTGVGIIVATSSGGGDTSGAVVNDPRIEGAFTFGVRVAMKGATLRYSPAKITGATTQRVRVDGTLSATDAPVLVNLRDGYPGQDASVIGWNFGEILHTNAEFADRWASGQLGGPRNGAWTTDERGGFTVPSSSAALFTAAFSADTEIRCEARFAAADTNAGRAVGVCLRVSAVSDYLAVGLDATGGVSIIKRAASTETTLASAALSLPLNVFHDLRAAIVGNVITVWVNGSFALAHTLAGGDETTYAGIVNHGLWGRFTTGRIRNVRVHSVT